jgi:hypothetical protein
MYAFACDIKQDLQRSLSLEFSKTAYEPTNNTMSCEESSIQISQKLKRGSNITE